MMNTSPVRVRSLSFIALTALALVACSDANAHDPNAPAVSARITSSDQTLDLAGTWAFDADRSDVAKPLQERCLKKVSGDTAKAAACWQEIKTEAANEKVRFSKTEGTRTTWTSFGIEDGKEAVFVEVPLELRAEGGGRIVGKVAGAATGRHGTQFTKLMTELRVEKLDPSTIVIVDPDKGRLLYVKE